LLYCAARIKAPSGAGVCTMKITCEVVRDEEAQKKLSIIYQRIVSVWQTMPQQKSDMIVWVGINYDPPATRFDSVWVTVKVKNLHSSETSADGFRFEVKVVFKHTSVSPGQKLNQIGSSATDQLFERMNQHLQGIILRLETEADKVREVLRRER
jgi:hypothetical protein